MTPDQRRLAHLQDVYKRRDPEQCDTAFLLGLLRVAVEALGFVVKHEDETLKYEPDTHRHNRYRENMYWHCKEALSKIRGGT